MRILVRLIIIGILVVVGMTLYVYTQAQATIQTQELYFEVEEGSSLAILSPRLQELFDVNENIIKGVFYLQGIENDIKAGTYFLDGDISLIDLSKRLAQSDFDVPEVRVTIVEGIPTYKVAEVVAEKLPNVEAEAFKAYVNERELEGYLYPDTYNFAERATVEDVIEKMQDNFDKKLSSIQSTIDSSPYEFADIITMASLIEGEAGNADLETRRKVSGVLWNRVRLGMPIQADAVFPFIFQEDLSRVLFRHLEVDSPYNIYKNIGLPPGPINHPSIVSIEAAANPSETSDLFYLTGFDGNFYYARTNAGHERNRRAYLNYRN